MQLRLAEMSVLAVTVLLVLSATAPGMVAGAGAVSDQQSPALGTANADLVSADTFLNASQDVTVWDRAALPLRVNTENAVTTVEGPSTYIYNDEIGEPPLNKDTVGVFETGSEISLEFDRRTGAGTDQFDGESVQLVAARVADDPDTSDVNESALADEARNITADEALDRLLAQNRSGEQLNRNFTFSVADTGEIDNGAVTTSFTPSEPGAYAFMLVASDNGEGVSVENGNASLSEDVRILGADAAPVQAATATAIPSESTVDPGENVTFGVESGLADQQTSHTVVLFNESELASQETTFNVDGELNTDLRADDVTIEHSVQSIDGVARLDADSQVMGVDLTDRSRSGTVGLTSLVQFLANETNQTAPDTTATGDAVLNASVTSVVNDSGSTTLDVGTSGNWSNGTYEYLYIAGTNDTNQFSTTKGNITVGAAEPEPEPREEVQLNLTVNRTEVEVNESIRLSVTRPNGDPVSDYQFSTGGPLVDAPRSEFNLITTAAGNYTIEVSKKPTDTETFLNDSVDITVNEASTGGGGDEVELTPGGIN